MPKKKIKEVNKEVPYYINADGTLDPTKIFKLQFKQTELLRTVIRDGCPYVMPVAPQCLSVGGFRSGKTVGWLMYLVMHYCLAWKKCDILVLRRTFPELENGAIKDFKTFVPQELYKYDQTKHIATFFNGSRVVFGHCEHNKMRDIEQYLGQAYPAILIDECGQFSPEAWQMLYTRNIVNPACERDNNLDAEGLGHLPIPIMIGCSNPIGPFYEYYRTVFVQKEPWQKPEAARQDTDGSWWLEDDMGVWKLLYDPFDYAYQRSTVMDNPALMKRDPAYFHKLDRLPKAERDKKLLGLDGIVEGQYFDCFDPTYHVINLREDPEAIIWQDYQPVWAGQDWGMGHANAVYFFTKALVRPMPNADYKLKTVCFAEIVTTGGKTYRELASIIVSKSRIGERKVTPKAIYFSHEKFARVMDVHSPADDYSRALKELGMPGVLPATRDRIGRASFMYNGFKNGELVILDSCKDIILSIPNLMRDPNQMDDVLKVDGRGDDCYDGFSYGYFGELKGKKRPAVEAIQDHAKKLEAQGPEGKLAAWFYRQKLLRDRTSENAPFIPPELPLWMSRVNQNI